MVFASVILGLAVSDLAISLHRLLDAGKRVRWDWLAPMAAVVAFLKIITQWWTWYGAAKIARGLTFEMFISVMVGVVLLFLLAAAALPDHAHEAVIDLRGHYAKVRRRFWGLFAAHWILVTGVSLWVQMQVSGARLTLMSPAYLIVPLAISLAVVRNRAWHMICLAGLMGVYVAQFFGQQLG